MLWHLLVNLFIWLIISSCYGSIPLAFTTLTMAFTGKFVYVTHTLTHTHTHTHIYI